jgi:hypothetical protein
MSLPPPSPENVFCLISVSALSSKPSWRHDGQHLYPPLPKKDTDIHSQTGLSRSLCQQRSSRSSSSSFTRSVSGELQ